MNPLQRAAVRRKAAYLAAILALFTLSIFYRGLEAKTAAGNPYVWVPFGRDDGGGGLADRLAGGTILSQARDLELREVEQGDPEVAGMTARLALTGTRGFVVAYLWYDAIDKQKRNDFHQFENRVKAVTALQPHFITPWIFQSWNISYNVSVEMQSMTDMYFYIARGIDLLAEGERRNKRSPDMRYWVGFYYQNKFGVSDQVQTLRCLFQLSCIPPGRRDPLALLVPGTGKMDPAGQLVPGTGEVDPAAFRQFCEDFPHLVRRLRGEERYDRAKAQQTASDTLRNKTPADVVEFLRANRKVPGRYKSATELADPAKQFPVLPPLFETGGGAAEAHPLMGFDDGFSGFGAARAWFAYGVSLCPPNPRDDEIGPIPWATPRPGSPQADGKMLWGEYDPKAHRVPRSPMLILYRQGPPRAQTYQAEMEQKDGWFDDEGWAVDAGIDPRDYWFPDALNLKATVARAGDGVYAVAVENPTAGGVTRVGLEVKLPAWAEVAAADPPAAAGGADRGALSWTLGDLPRGQRREVKLTLRRKAGAAAADAADPTAAAAGVALVGAGRGWSRVAWLEAAKLWRKHGEENALILSPGAEERLRAEAGLEKGAEPAGVPPDLPPAQMADRDTFRRWRATSGLFYYRQNRQVTNFPYYLASSEAEQQGDTVAARKVLWQAELARRVGDMLAAARLYRDGLERWKGVLLRNKDFHRPDRFDAVEEQTYEYELDYLRLIAQDDPAVRQKAREEYAAELSRGLPAFAAAGAVIPETLRADKYMAAAEKHFSPFADPMPADLGDGRGGGPWVRDEIKDSVLVRQGIPRAPKYSGNPQGRPPGPGGPTGQP